jgi:2-keto-4-pentenoate hydratase
MNVADADAEVADALREQLSRQRQLIAGGAQRVGWKIALGIEEVDDRPLIGYLTSATLLAPEARHSARDAADLRVDAEIAVIVDRGYAAALELVDLGQGRGSVRSVIRTNVLHRALALAQPPQPFHGSRARIWVDQELRAEAPLEFDPDQRVEIARDWLDVLGERLEPGDTVITGSIVQVPVAPGDGVAVDLGELGRVAVTITA